MIDNLSITAVPLRLTCNGLELTKATGSFYRAGDEVFLITNWHVLSGQNPTNFQPTHKSGALPNEVHFPMYLQNESPFETCWVTASLVDSSGYRVWLEHCHYGPQVDIAALRVTYFQTEIETIMGLRKRVFYCLTDWVIQGIEYFIGEDLFILGFPLDYRCTGHFPIWKRASIASEPQLNVDNVPMFLIDTATRPGMSGSPAIKITVNSATASNYDAKDAIHSRSIRFLGIYSGRFVGEAQEAQLGKVWKEVLIQDIIAVPTQPETDYAILADKWGVQNGQVPSWLPEPY